MNSSNQNILPAATHDFLGTAVMPDPLKPMGEPNAFGRALEDDSGPLASDGRVRFDENAETERTGAWRRARAEAGEQMLMSRDFSKLSDAGASALYQSVSKALFGLSDPDGSVAFGRRAAKDPRHNLDLLRRFVNGEYGLIEDEEYTRWKTMDEEGRFQYALENEGSGEKVRSYFKNERGAGFLEMLGTYMAPSADMSLALSDEARENRANFQRRSDYNQLSDDEKAAYRADVIGDYEKKLSRRQVLANFLQVSGGLSDRASYLLAKSFNDGTPDVNVETLDPEERDKVYSAFSMMRGDQKRGRLLGISTDFTDDTVRNRLQLGLYGFQQSILGLVTDTRAFARDAGVWIYAKAALSDTEREEFFKGWDANARAEMALKQGLPEADSFIGAAFQGVAENLHWFIPYGAIGKGKAMMKAARSAAAAKETAKTLEAGKAAAEAGAAAIKAQWTLDVNGVKKLGEMGEALLARQTAAVKRYTKMLGEVNKSVKLASAWSGDAGAGMRIAGEASSFSAFAHEYIAAADAAGISREESVITAALIGLVNARIERLYVPGLESSLAPAQIKGLTFQALAQAVRSDGAAGFRAWAQNRIAKGVTQGAKVAASEGLIEEPLQQLAQEHAKAFDRLCEELRADGKATIANEAKALLGSIAETLPQDYATYIDAAADALSSSVGFGAMTIGNMTRGQTYRNWRQRRKTGVADYDEGVVDVVQRAINTRKVVENYWKEAETPPEAAENAAPKNPNRFVEALTAARQAYRHAKTGDVVREVAQAAQVDIKTAEVLAEYLQIETEAATFSPRVSAFRDIEMSLADIDEKTIASVMPGYVPGSFAADRENGIYSGRVKLSDGTERTIAYRIGDFSGEIAARARENAKIDSKLGVSYDANVIAAQGANVVKWAQLSDHQRYLYALEAASVIKGWSSGVPGVFELIDAKGEKVTVNADDIINLANGRIADIGYGAAATQATVRHETFHSLWRFSRSSLDDADVQTLAKALGVDVTAKDWEVTLDEAMAVELERYASGHYVSHAVSSRLDRMVDGFAGQMVRFFGSLGVADEVKDPEGKAYRLKDFYDRVLRGELGSGKLGVRLAKLPEEPGKAAATASTLPVEVTDEDRAAQEAAEKAAMSEEEPEASAAGVSAPTAPRPDPAAQAAAPTATLENPADASVGNQRFYRVGLPNSAVKIVGRLEVVDADAGLITSTDEDYADRGNQNRDDKSEESRALVEKIGANPDALQLATVQPVASNGVAWMLPNRNVIIGNHRMNGVRLAYAKGTAANVEKFVREEAAKRGIEIAESVKKPILVFVLERVESPDGKADAHEVVRLANESQNRGFNVREQAFNDAKILTDNALLSRMTFRDDGSIDDTKSGEAIGIFRRETGAQGMIAEDGALTEKGQERIQNAALAALLGGQASAALLGKIMASSKALDIKPTLRALMKMTPELMALGEAKGKEAYDLGAALGEAMQLYTEWREADENARREKGKTKHNWRKRTKEGKRLSGLAWEAFKSQGDMFRQPSAEALILGDLFARAEDLRSFDREDIETAAGKKQVVDLIGGYLTDYIANARAVNTDTVDMFGAAPPARAEVLRIQREQGLSGPRFSVAGAPGYQAQYAAVVARYTNKDGTKRPGWMRAPNGKPSNLTERQWVQVRTSAFKNWFGDWEKAANANNVADWLLNTAPIAGISGEEFKKPASGENTLVDRVESFYKENFGGSVRSADLGDVILNRDGIKASVAHGIGRNKAAAFALVPDVIKHGRILNTYQNWKGRGYDSAVIVAPVSIHGEDFICEVIVTTEFGKQGFYLHEVNLKKDVASTIKTATGAVSTRDVAQPTKSSIAKILTEVNEATSKVVDENGEPKVVYHGTKGDFTVFDESLTGKNYEGFSKNGGGFYFTSDEYAANVWAYNAHGDGDDNIMNVFLNVRNPYTQDDFKSVSELKQSGFDGIHVKSKYRDEFNSVVFDPAQIKSATDNTGAFDGSNPDIRFSIGARRQEEYRHILSKRSDLDADAVIAQLDSFETPKEQKIALHWIMRGTIILPEDREKVSDALSVAEKAKVDPFRYESPMELMNEHADFRPTRKPIAPDTVPQFTNRDDRGNGVVVYDVEDSREGQKAVREILNTHRGKDCSPWCLAQGDGKGNISSSAWDFWNTYNAVQKKIAFKNGKVVAFHADKPKTIELVNWEGEVFATFTGPYARRDAEEKADEWRNEAYGYSGMQLYNSPDAEEYGTLSTLLEDVEDDNFYDNDDFDKIESVLSGDDKTSYSERREIYDAWESEEDGELPDLGKEFGGKIIAAIKARMEAIVNEWNEWVDSEFVEVRGKDDGSFTEESTWWDMEDQSHSSLAKITGETRFSVSISRKNARAGTTIPNVSDEIRAITESFPDAPQNALAAVMREKAKYGVGSAAANGAGFIDLAIGDTFSQIENGLRGITKQVETNPALGVSASIGSNTNANELARHLVEGEDEEAHKFAAKNVIALFKSAPTAISHYDKKGSGNRFLRFFSPYYFRGELHLAVITAKELNAKNKLYSIEDVKTIKDATSASTSRPSASGSGSASNADFASFTLDKIAYYVGDVNRTDPKFLASNKKFTVEALYEKIVKDLKKYEADKKVTERFSLESALPGSVYPQFVNQLSDDELVASAIAARMALGASAKVSDRAVKLKTVQDMLRRVHPEWNANKLGVESQRIIGEATKLAVRIREDIDRGVSESRILAHLPETARATFGEEMRAEARRGVRLGAFNTRVNAEISERQAKMVEDAVRVQTGIDADNIENAWGINLAETIMRFDRNWLKPNLYGKEAAPKDDETTQNPTEPAADGLARPAGEPAAEVDEKVAKVVTDLMAATATAARVDEQNRAEGRRVAARDEANANAEAANAQGATGADMASGGEDTQDVGGDRLAAAVRKHGLDLESPRHLAHFIVELARRQWIKEHGLALNAEVWHDLVAVQFLRKTAQSVYEKLVKDLTYSRSRETAMTHVAKFDAAPTVAGLISEMEFVGALINASRIRESQQEKCEKLDLFLRQHFSAQGRFQPDKEEGKRKVSAEAELWARYMRHAMWLTPEAASDETLDLTRTLETLSIDFNEAGRDVIQSREFVETVRKLNVLREFGALRYKPLGEIDAAWQWWLDFERGAADDIMREMSDREIRTTKAAHLLAIAFTNPKAKTVKDARTLADRLGNFLTGHMGFHSLVNDCMRFASDADRAAVEEIVGYIFREIQKAGDRTASEKRRHNDAFYKAVEQIYGKSFNAVMKEMTATDEQFLEFMGTVGGKRVIPTKGRAMQLLVSLLQEGRKVEVEDPDKPGEKKTIWVNGYHDNIVRHKREGQAAKLMAKMSPADLNMIKWLGQWYEQNRNDLSNVCQGLFGIGVYAELPNYFPVKMMLEKQGLEKGAALGWSIFPKALTPRVKNERDFDTSADIFQMWAARMEEGAQWKHHARLGLEMRGIFGRSELQSAVVASHGTHANDLMQSFITDILAGQGAIDRTTGGTTVIGDEIRGWTALCALGGNVGVMLKQTTSIPAFGFEIGLVNTAKHVVRAFTPEGMAAMAKIWNSEQRKTRWDVGSSEAVQNALNRRDAGALKRLFQAAMITNKIGDAVPTLVVGQGIYRDLLEQGMSEEDAMAEMWSIAERTQQSGRMENQINVQRRNRLGRTFYQFLSTNNQMLQYETRAIREVIASPASVKRWGKLGRVVILNHLVLTSAYFWMGELYKACLGQEPPEDQLKDWVITCLLGSWGSLMVLGFMCKATLDRAIKGYSFGRGSPMLPMEGWVRTQINDGAKLTEAIFSAEGDTWDEMVDAAAKWMSDVNSTVRDLRKIYRFRVKGQQDQ